MTNVALFTAFFLSFPAPANVDRTDCPPQCQLEQVGAYFRALDEVFQEGSTIAEIDALFSILHEEVRYVHAAFEADFQREEWRAAFIGNLERGVYRNGPERQIGIMTAIHGKNAVAVEYSHGEVLSDGTWESSEPLLAVFRFRDGKISLIEELW
jgi:hypothetical protein